MKMRHLISSTQCLLNRSKAFMMSELNILVTILLSENLYHMSEYFLSQNKLDLAKLAAFWSVQKILKVQLKLEQVANSFTALMKVLRVKQESLCFEWVFEAAQIQIARALFSSDVNMDGLTAVAKAYSEFMVYG
jgi:hypothetical protein